MSTKTDIQKMAESIIANMPSYASEIASRQVEKPQYRNVEKPGDYLFKIEDIVETDSRSQYNGKPKPADKLPPYVDATKELAMKLRVVSDDEDLKGRTFITRIHFATYVRDVDVPEDKLDDYEMVNGYACVRNEEGELVRQISQARMPRLHAVHDQIAYALGEEGNIVESIVSAHAKGTVFGLKIVADDSYDGTTRLKEGNWFPADALLSSSVKAELEGDFGK